MTTSGDLLLLGLGLLAFVLLCFGYALIAYDECTDPDALPWEHDDEPLDTDSDPRAA
jgi:hypothetical protein